jgi:putative phosphoribosyl transferase
MGKIIGDALGGELDVILVHKLGAPHNPELAVGSIDETGAVYLDEGMRDLWTEPYLAAERAAQLNQLRQRRHLYGPPVDAGGRTVIVLDDGIATGSTMIAALRAVRARQPERLVAAAAVGAPEALRVVGQEADEVVCVEEPAHLYAIGHYFRDFSQVSDEEVVAILREARAKAVETGPAHES